MMSNEKCGSKIHVFVINNVKSIEKEKKVIDEEEEKKKTENKIELNDDKSKSDEKINLIENNSNKKKERKEEIITHKIYYPQVKIVKVSCGKSIIGFLSFSGKIYCWHLNNFNDFDKNVPYLLVDNLLKNKTIHDVSSGYNHIAFISKDGELYTYGDNTYGQLGNNRIYKDDYPEEIDRDKCNNINNYKIKNQKKYKVYKVDVQNNIVKYVYSSEKYTLYLTIDGLLYGFGLINEHFIKGKNNRNIINKILRKPHHIYTNDIAFKKISIGINFILAINFNNFVYSWGENSTGVLGHNNCIDSYEPKQIDNLRNVVYISAGKISLCKTLEEEIYIWGGNYGNKPNLIKNKFDDMHINNNFIIGLCGKKNIWVKNIDNVSHGYYINNLKINLLCSYDNLIIGVENYEEYNDINEKNIILLNENKKNSNTLNTSVGNTENGVNTRNKPIDIVNNYICIFNEKKNNNNNNSNNDSNNSNYNSNSNNNNYNSNSNNGNNNNSNDYNSNNSNSYNSNNSNNYDSNNSNNYNSNNSDNSNNYKRELNDNLYINDDKQVEHKGTINTNNLNSIKDNAVTDTNNTNEYKNECDNAYNNNYKNEFNDNNNDIYDLQNNKKHGNEYDGTYDRAGSHNDIYVLNENKNSNITLKNNEWEKRNRENYILDNNFSNYSASASVKEEFNNDEELNIQETSSMSTIDNNEEKKNYYVKEIGKDVTNLNYVNNIHNNNIKKNDINNFSSECVDDKKYSMNYKTSFVESIESECKNNKNNNNSIYANSFYEMNKEENEKENENNYLNSSESNIKNIYYNEVEMDDNYMKNIENDLKDDYERKHEIKIEDEYYDEDYEDDNNFYDDNDSSSLDHRNIIIINKKMDEKDQYNLKSSLKKSMSNERIKKTVSFSNYVYDLAKNNYELINLNSNDEMSQSEEEKEDRTFSYDDNTNEFHTNNYNMHNKDEEDKNIHNINRSGSYIEKEVKDKENISSNDFQNKPNDSVYVDNISNNAIFHEDTQECKKEENIYITNVNVEKNSIYHAHDLLVDLSTNSKEKYTSHKDKLKEGKNEKELVKIQHNEDNTNMILSNSSNEFHNSSNIKTDYDKETMNEINNEKSECESALNNKKWTYSTNNHEEENDYKYINDNNNEYLNIGENRELHINTYNEIMKTTKKDHLHSESYINPKTKNLSKKDQENSIYDYKNSNLCQHNENNSNNIYNNNMNNNNYSNNTNKNNNMNILSGVECPYNIPSYSMNKKGNMHLSNDENEFNYRKEKFQSSINPNSSTKKGLGEFNFFSNSNNNNNNSYNDFVHNSFNCCSRKETKNENFKNNEKEHDGEVSNKRKFTEHKMNKKLYNEEKNNEKNIETYFNKENYENYLNEIHLENKYEKTRSDENTYSKDMNEDIKYEEEGKKMNNNIKKKSNNILENKVNSTKTKKFKPKLINKTQCANDNNNKYVSHENNKMRLANNTKDVKECRNLNKSDYFEYILLKKLKRNLKISKECNYFEMRKIKKVLSFIKNNQVIDFTKKLRLKSSINKINKIQDFLKIIKKSDKNLKLQKQAKIVKQNKKYLKNEINNLSSKNKQIKNDNGRVNKSKCTMNDKKNYITTNITTNNITPNIITPNNITPNNITTANTITDSDNVILQVEDKVHNKKDGNKKKIKNINSNKNVLISKKKEALTLYSNGEKKITEMLGVNKKSSDNKNCIIKQNNLKRNLSEGNITKLKVSNVGKKRSLSNKEQIINNKNLKNDKNTQNKQTFMSCLSVNTLNKNYIDCNNKNELSEKKVLSHMKRNVSAFTLSDISNNKSDCINDYSKFKKNEHFSNSDKVPNTSTCPENIYKTYNSSNYDYKKLCDAYNNCNNILKMEKQQFRINSLSFEEIKNLKKEELTVPFMCNKSSSGGKNTFLISTSNNHTKKDTYENISNEKNINKSNDNFYVNWGVDTSNTYQNNVKMVDSIQSRNRKDNNEYNNLECNKYDKGYGSECDEEEYEMNHICNKLLKKKRSKLLIEKELKHLRCASENNITNQSTKLNKENDSKKVIINNLYDSKFKTYEVHKNNEKYPLNRNCNIKNEKKSNDIIKKKNIKGSETLCIYDINQNKQNVVLNNKSLSRKYILSTNNNYKKEANFQNSITHNNIDFNKNEKFGSNNRLKKIEDKKYNENENKNIEKIPLGKKKNNKSILLKNLHNEIIYMKNDILNENNRRENNLKICDKNSDYSDNISYKDTKNIMSILNNENEYTNYDGCKYYLLNIKKKLKSNLKKKKHKKYVNKIYKTMKYIFNEYNIMKKEKEDANKRNDYLKFLLENTVAKTNEMLRINKNSFQSYIEKVQKENSILKNELDEESYQHHYDLQQLVNKITNMEKVKDYIMGQNEEYNKKIIVLAMECDKLEKKKKELLKIIDEYKLNLEKEKKKKKYILRNIGNSLKVWETDYNELKEKYDTIKDKNEELINNNEELKQETLKLKEELYSKDVIINKKIEKINNLNMSYVSLKNDYKNNISDNMYTNKTYDDLLSKYETMEEFYKKNTENLEKELLEKEKQIHIFEKEKEIIQDKYLDISKNLTILKSKLRNFKNYKPTDSSLELFLENSINTIFKNLDNVDELKTNENLKNKIIDIFKNFITNKSFIDIYNCNNNNLNKYSNVSNSDIDHSTTNYRNNDSDLESIKNSKNLLTEEDLKNSNIHNKLLKNKKHKKTVIDEMKKILLSLEKKKNNSNSEEKLDELLSEKDVNEIKKLLKDNIDNNKNKITKETQERVYSESNSGTEENKKKKNKKNKKKKMFDCDDEQVIYLKNKISELTKLKEKHRIKIKDEQVDKINEESVDKMKENYENDAQVIGICEEIKKKKDDADDSKGEVNREKETGNIPIFQDYEEKYIKTKIRNLHKSNIKKNIKNDIELRDTTNDSLNSNTQNENYNDFKNNTQKNTLKENYNNKSISKKNTQLKEIISNDFLLSQNNNLTDINAQLEGMPKLNDTNGEKNMNINIKSLLESTKKVNSNNLKSQGVNKNSKKKKKSFNAVLDKIFDTPIDHSSINENMLNIQNLIENNIKNIFSTEGY